MFGSNGAGLLVIAVGVQPMALSRGQGMTASLPNPFAWFGVCVDRAIKEGSPVAGRCLGDLESIYDRLLTAGAEALTEREMLALVIRNGRPGASALAIADQLLDEFGGVAGIAEARAEELTTCAGVGPARAAAVIAAIKLGSVALGATPTWTALSSSEQVAAAARSRLLGERRERVLVLVADGRNQLRRVLAVSQGGSDRVLVPVREVLNAVLRHDGRAFAVAHNHPSGDPTPSEADRRSTEILASAAQLVGLRFLDHVVIAGMEWRSAR